MFLQIFQSKDGQNFIPLEKIHKKQIEEKNIKSAQLYISTLEKGNYIDITNMFKKAVYERKSDLFFKKDFEFCTEDCDTNKYPFAKIHYVFNRPPKLSLITPENNTTSEFNNIYFGWEGLNKDGKFLEYSIEISKDINFQKDVIRTQWSKNNFHREYLQNGNYFWKVTVRDNSFLNNVVVSEIFNFRVNGDESEYLYPALSISPTKITQPKNNSLINTKQISFRAKTHENLFNRIFLNNRLLLETRKNDIKININLQKEGKNVIRIVSLRKGWSMESSVTFYAKWTPPSHPNFEFKIEQNRAFLRISNQDYKKAYIYIGDNFLKDVRKTKNWIDLNKSIHSKTRIGVMLEDKFGNRSKLLYRELNPREEILGIRDQLKSPPNPSFCLYKYNSTYRTFQSKQCNITTPEILKLGNITKDKKTYSVNVGGLYNPNMSVFIDEYLCTLPLVCAERFIKRTRIDTKPYTAINVYINNNFRRINEFRKINDYFFTARVLEKRNPEGKRISLIYNISHSFRYDGRWVDINLTSPHSNIFRIPPPLFSPDQNTNRIFDFPFSRNIGVTQWHGYTAFQSPHTGIDFGSYREPVYAIANGTIKDVGWDNYSGRCLSGGNFVRIEHENGMNSVYLHLENYKKRSGQNWRIGEKIKKGELIGRSGNTGHYNCQPLGYHLHFELRKDSSHQNHVNPVPYIKINWDNIPTINHINYPGRLTGNNPHPTW